MNARPLIIALAFAALSLGAAVSAVSAAPGDGKPVNAMCPIGKEPIVPTAGTVEHKGQTIGLCCPSCGKAFLAWEESRRDEFVALAMVGEEPGQETHGSGAPAAAAEEGKKTKTSDAEVIEAQLMHYPLDTCIVSGEKLDEEAVDFVHEGRLVRFCCGGCVRKFKADPGPSLAKLDEKIIKLQVEDYPLDACPVSGAKLGSMGDPVNHIYQNRLVRFCCGGCTDRFEAKADEFMKQLDEAYADAQRDAYALEECVVSGAALGSMGEPYEIVAGTRLVRFCCKGCLPRFRSAPGKYLARIPAP